VLAQEVDTSPDTLQHFVVLREDIQKVANGHITLCSAAVHSLECAASSLIALLQCRCNSAVEGQPASCVAELSLSRTRLKGLHKHMRAIKAFKRASKCLNLNACDYWCRYRYKVVPVAQNRYSVMRHKQQL
jgi:hypothetical protein